MDPESPRKINEDKLRCILLTNISNEQGKQSFFQGFDFEQD